MFDLGVIYEQAKAASREAIARSGDDSASYGLEDVMPEEAWVSVGSSRFGSLIPVNATLSGCVEALRARGVSAADVGGVSANPPEGTAVTTDDVGTARDWLVKAFALDDDGCENMIFKAALARGWVGKPIQITSLVLALVVVAHTAAVQ